MKLRPGSLKCPTKLTNLSQTYQKEKESPINKISEKEKVTTDITQIQKIIRSYYYSEQLHANKLDNLEEMEKFLEIYNPPRLNQK